MADLGLYNFIKTESAKGKSKEEIIAELAKGPNSPEAIQSAYEAFDRHIPPAISVQPLSPIPPLAMRGPRPISITVVCVILMVLTAINLLTLIPLALIFVYNPGATILATSMLLVITAIPAFIAYGYWRMRKWAVYLCAILVAFSIVTSLVSQPAQLVSLNAILAYAAVAVGFYHLSEMS